MIKRAQVYFVILTCGALVSQPSQAQTISMNFNNGGATLLDAADFVGVVPRPNWNNFRNNGGRGLSNPNPTALVDSTGADSGATITWEVGSSFFNSNNGVGNQRMMEGWFGLNAADAGNITVSDLPPSYTNSGYDAYVYFDSNEVAPNERTMSFTVGGTTISGKELDANFPGSFTEASGGSVGNYVVFRGLTDSTFSLTADADVGRAAINGIQITTEMPLGPDSPIHQYDASATGNTVDTWFDRIGGASWSLASAQLNDVVSPFTTISKAYQLTQSGPGAGGDTGPFPGGQITYELWVRPSELGAEHQVVFETGGGQNGSAILMNNDVVRYINSQGNARTHDLSLALDGIDTSDFVQIVAALNPSDGEVTLFVNGAAGGSASMSSQGIVGRGGNRATLFSWGSGAANIGNPLDEPGGTFNLGGRTELPDMTPEGLTQFAGEIGLMNVYDRTFAADDVQMAFDSVFIPEPSTFGMIMFALLGLVGRIRRAYLPVQG